MTPNQTTTKITTAREESECQKSDKIVFLKTHKTGSETMAGIFRRYAIMNNVSTLLSTRFGGHLYSQNAYHTYDPIHPKHVKMIGQNLPGAHYELVTNHMTYNQPFINRMFPNAKKISILRNPVSHLKSSWTYYYKLFANNPHWEKVESEARQIMQLFEYLGNPLKFQYQALQLPKTAYRHLLRSQLASFGYHDKVFSQNLGKELVSKWIHEIDQDFDLILIMEYFDYSLALLCIELCWPIEYVANLKMNEGHHIPVRSKAYHEELIRTINYPDFMLYEHFNRTFWERIEEVGIERVTELASQITELSMQLETDCVSKYHEIKNWNGKMVSEPVLRNDKKDDLYCKSSVLWGNEQSEFLKKRQWQLIKNENWSAIKSNSV